MATLLVARLLVLVALVAPHVAVWQARHLPTQDGPLHVYNATLPIVWPNAGDAPASPRIGAYFEPRPTLASWLPQRVLGLAIRVAGIRVGERLFVSGYLLLFAASAWFVVTSLRRENGILAVLVAALAMNFPLSMGFYPFAASLPPTLFATGLWARAGHRRPVSLACLAMALAAATFCHPMGLAVAGALTLGVSAGRIASAPRGERWREAWRELLPLGVAALAGLAVLAGSMEANERRAAYLLPGLGRLLMHLTTAPDWVSYSSLEWVPAARRPGRADRRRAVGGGARAGARGRSTPLMACCWPAWRSRASTSCVPDYMATGGYVRARLFLWSVIAASLWAASVPHPASRTHGARQRRGRCRDHAGDDLRPAISPARSAARGARLGDARRAAARDPPRSQHGRRRCERPNLTRYARAASIAFLHAAGAIGAHGDVVLLDNYQAQRSHFPIQFKPSAAYFDSNSVDAFPWGSLAWPDRAIESAPEYVLIWGPIEPALFPESALPTVLAMLDRDYRLVYVSRPHGLARLWRRR